MDVESSAILMQRFRRGDDSAAELLFARYFDRLDRFAERQMTAKLQRRVGPDDIAQSVYRSFFAKAKMGVYNVKQSGELWKLLAFLAKRKVQQHAEWHSAKKRNSGKEQPLNSDRGEIDIADRSGASEVVAVNDAIEYVLSRVCGKWKQILSAAESEPAVGRIAACVGESETDVRRVLILRMQCAGHLENEQIADILGCSEVTVRRIWRSLLQLAKQLAETE
ncbi:MAG: ECF-type sigma factor [Planctomycetaceae bacterium]